MAAAGDLRGFTETNTGAQDVVCQVTRLARGVVACMHPRCNFKMPKISALLTSVPPATVRRTSRHVIVK